MTCDPETNTLVILLHGVGLDGEHMLAGLKPWCEEIPNAILASPDAPFSSVRGVGRQWFDVSGITDQNRPHRIAAARPEFDRVLGSEIERHGFSGRLDRVALVGFSQGSMMLIDAVASGRWPVAVAVAFAGRLTSAPTASPKQRTRLLLLQGAADTVVPPIELDRAIAELRSSGFDVESQMFPDMGHVLAPEAIRVAIRFLRSRFAATRADQEL